MEKYTEINKNPQAASKDARPVPDIFQRERRQDSTGPSISTANAGGGASERWRCRVVRQRHPALRGKTSGIQVSCGRRLKGVGHSPLLDMTRRRLGSMTHSDTELQRAHVECCRALNEG